MRHLFTPITSVYLFTRMKPKIGFERLAYIHLIISKLKFSCKIYYYLDLFKIVNLSRN